MPRWGSLLVLALAAPLPAQSPSARPPQALPLEFVGLRAGAHLAEIRATLEQRGEARLRCKRAKADPRVSECRAVIAEPGSGRPLDLWLSAIDSVAAVLTVSAPVTAEQLAEWRGGLERRYGRVGARAQGAQWMMQWVRQGRMIRLTWRVQRTEKIASVSLVDGRVLDAWGRARAQPASSTR